MPKDYQIFKTVIKNQSCLYYLLVEHELAGLSVCLLECEHTARARRCARLQMYEGGGSPRRLPGGLPLAAPSLERPLFIFMIIIFCLFSSKNRPASPANASQNHLPLW